jgi:hypothetical protein
MIKDLGVGMVQIPRKFVMMHVVIAKVTPTYVTLLSKHWGTYVGGSVQFELSYAIIPIFRGDTRHLYREPKMTCVITDQNPSNFPSCSSNSIGNFLLICELSLAYGYEYFMCEE